MHVLTISDKSMEYAMSRKPEDIDHIHVAEGIEDLHSCFWKALSVELLTGHLTGKPP